MAFRNAFGRNLAACGVWMLAWLLLSSCGGGETATQPAVDAGQAATVQALATTKQQVEAQKAALTPRPAEWTYGDTVSQLTGFYQGESLRLVEEQMNMGEFGSASAKYFYSAQGKLFAYQETKESRSGKAANAVKTEQSTLQLFFGEDGRLLSGERTVDGQPSALVGIEEQAVRMHATELEAALADAAKKP
jgi:hypothetical protein